MMYREFALPERFAAARSDGFRAVEILSPEGVPVEQLADAARGAGIEVVLCNAPMGDFLDGGPGMSAVPGREDEFQQAIESARDMAVALNCSIVHLGPSRVPEGARRSDCLEVLAGNVAAAAGMLADDGITVTIEPMNTVDFPDICLRDVDDALGVLQAVHASNAALQFDIYHMSLMEDDLIRSIEENAQHIAHFQFADSPGRHEPSSGTLDFPEIFRRIDELGYSGHLGAEYSPSGKTSESLTWFDRYRQ